MTEPPKAMRLPVADSMLGGRYRLVERIAGGGMGEVWRAVDEVLGRAVAVKILRREFADDPTFRERFRAEARHTAGLAHPGIAAVYDFGQADADGSSSPYLVMELVDGEPLDQVIAREGVLPLDRTLQILGNAALGVQAAHDAGVIHRDIKPANILVHGTDVKITDFGISRATNSVPLTQTGAIMGTAYYISPEQASGSAVSPASDLYSLGVVAYECLTGRRPFAGNTPVSVALAQVHQPPPPLPASTPQPVRDLVMQLLSKDPADRPASAGEVGTRALALAPLHRGVVTADAAPPTQVLPLTDGDGGQQVVPLSTDHRRDPRGDTDPGFALPPLSRRPGWLRYAAALALVALLLLVVGRSLADDSGPAAGPESAQDPTPAQRISVLAKDLVGRPVHEVRAELRNLGLRVRVRSTEGGGPVGTVKKVDPTGSLRADTMVTLTAVAQPTGDDGDKHDEDKDRDEDRGKGKGKGRSEDKGKDD